jgi:hypothetical protein
MRAGEQPLHPQADRRRLFSEVGHGGACIVDQLRL